MCKQLQIYEQNDAHCSLLIALRTPHSALRTIAGAGAASPVGSRRARTRLLLLTFSAARSASLPPGFPFRLTPRASPLTRHSSLVTPPASVLTDGPSGVTGRSVVLTRHPSWLTPRSAGLTGHPSPLTRRPSGLTRRSAGLTARPLGVKRRVFASFRWFSGSPRPWSADLQIGVFPPPMRAELEFGAPSSRSKMSVPSSTP